MPEEFTQIERIAWLKETVIDLAIDFQIELKNRYLGYGQCSDKIYYESKEALK